MGMLLQDIFEKLSILFREKLILHNIWVLYPNIKNTLLYKRQLNSAFND